jgi:hypothetical protein
MSEKIVRIGDNTRPATGSIVIRVVDRSVLEPPPAAVPALVEALRREARAGRGCRVLQLRERSRK